LTGSGPGEGLDLLLAGKVLLLQTDTLPGLHALATVPGSAQRMADLKGHPPDRPYLLLVPSADAAFQLGRAADAALERRLRLVWPGPVTALLSPLASTPTTWTDGGRTVGIRVPDAPGLRALLQQLPGPLFSTSANRAGEPAAEDIAEAVQKFTDITALDLGDPATGVASAIVDCTVNPPQLIRAGDFDFGAGFGL
jgi:L-threonylcarbamoyladenylate synthase